MRKAARERVAGEDAGAMTAAALIAAAEPADASHPYLVAKGIDAHGLYVADAGQTMMVRSEDGVTKECSIGGCLLVPLRTIDGKLRSVHAIAADGTRLSLGGAQTTGTFHLLGELRPGEPVAIAKGYAAAATVHRADGMTVAVGKGTDWNDYEIRYGRTAAKALLHAGTTEAIALNSPETQQTTSHQSMSA